MAASYSTADHAPDNRVSTTPARSTVGRIARKEILADHPAEITSAITAEMIEAGARALRYGSTPDWFDCELVTEIYAEMIARA